MSAMISETLSWELGPYRIQQRPHHDNPAWPCYIVFRGARFVGKSFSMPDLGCCQWLERFDGSYATKSQPAQGHAASQRWRRRLVRRGTKPAT